MLITDEKVLINQNANYGNCATKLQKIRIN